MKWELDVDDLMPYMPLSVREEYAHAEERRPASMFGFSEGVKKWLETSSLPRVEKWRNDLRRFHAIQQEQAIKEQMKMIDISSSLPVKTNGKIRPITHPIHPILKADLHRQDRHACHDPSSINDTKKRNPKLFIKEGK